MESNLIDFPDKLMFIKPNGYKFHLDLFNPRKLRTEKPGKEPQVLKMKFRMFDDSTISSAVISPDGNTLYLLNTRYSYYRSDRHANIICISLHTLRQTNVINSDYILSRSSCPWLEIDINGKLYLVYTQRCFHGFKETIRTEVKV